ncbi:MAG: MATE family efflux transporter [Bacteroidales bacterium]|nr:MATE family efflux transporter [Bacteroidales bacterium]
MAKGQKDELLGMIREGRDLRLGQQVRLAFMLSLPAILAQTSSMLMQYIDTGMVGRLGANPSASIGLIATSTWILGGFTAGACSGFSVQVAHLCGANDFKGARRVLREGLSSVLILSFLLAGIGIALSGPLPRWLGGGPEIIADASKYFLIYSAFIPVGAVGWAASAMLQASGNMKVPSVMFTGMCVLDVIFNYIFIFVCGMGVAGAALGTGLSELVTSAFAVWFVLAKSKELNIKGEKGSFKPRRLTLHNAWGITAPMWLQNIIMRGAYVMSTVIVAPLGAIAIAANAFAITAESFCYMPSYGIEEASTTLIGQSLGAGRKQIAKRFSRITVTMGAAIQTLLGVVMFIFAPELMGLLSVDPDVVALGAKVLRIEAFAETMYAISIVGYGCCVGAGDTLMPSVMNFCSMWLVRIGLAAILTPKMGLRGYWIAMCVELNLRGLLFLWRLHGDKWMKHNVIGKRKDELTLSEI